MNERDKDIVDIRKERDDCAMLLRRFIHATREGFTMNLEQNGRIRAIADLRRKAQNYLEHKGLQGSPLR